jgi:hypothetical protein
VNLGALKIDTDDGFSREVVGLAGSMVGIHSDSGEEWDTREFME